MIMIWLQRNRFYVIGAALLATSVVLRLFSYPVVSADYTSSLSHWMDALRGSPGLTAFRESFSNYSPLYLYFLKLLTLISVHDLYLIKTLSLVADVAMAFIASLIVRLGIKGRVPKGFLILVGAVVFALPTVILNSSLWAQSDSVYAAFVLASLYCLLKNKPLWSAIWFGVAFSFKLQAVFFFPILAGYLLAKKHGWSYMCAIPAAYIITIIPAALSGGSFFFLLLTYFRQTGEFSDLSLSAPSIFSLFDQYHMSGTIQGILSAMGILSASILFAGIAYTAWRMVRTRPANTGVRNQKNEEFIFLSLFSVLIIPFFLPHMHERYFYLADIISVIFAFYRPRFWFVPVIVVGCSLFSYMPFLSGSVAWFAHLSGSIGIFGAMLLFLILGMIPKILRLGREATPGVIVTPKQL